MNTSNTGQQAETVAGTYLEGLGYEIVARNWRTRWCEIDIVAKQGHTLYFVEVKYRQSARQGTGLDYITPRKLEQMQFAANQWVHAHDWRGDYRLAAVEVSGTNFSVSAYIDDIIT